MKDGTADLLALKSVGNLALNLETLLFLHCFSVQIFHVQVPLPDTALCFLYVLESLWALFSMQGP